MRLVEEITGAEPHTMTGLIAKAQATAAAIGRYLDDGTADPETVMGESLALDVLRILGAEPWPEHPADAEWRQRIAARRAAAEGGAA